MMYASHYFITVEGVESSIEYVFALVAAYLMLIGKEAPYNFFTPALLYTNYVVSLPCLGLWSTWSIQRRDRVIQQ